MALLLEPVVWVVNAQLRFVYDVLEGLKRDLGEDLYEACAEDPQCFDTLLDVARTTADLEAMDVVRRLHEEIKREFMEIIEGDC